MIYHIENIIRNRLLDWTDTRIEWPNSVFQRTDGEPYIRVQYDLSDARQSALYSDKHDAVGYILISVFVPVKIGTDLLNRTADKLLSKMTFWGDAGLRCRSGVIKNGPKQPIWFQKNVTIDFNYNQCLEA